MCPAARRHQQPLTLVRDAQRLSQPPLLAGVSHARPVVIGTPDRRRSYVWNDQPQVQHVLRATTGNTCLL
ncbi:unnamed protein product [Ectocarpus sp. 12 AP-2014]